MDPPLEVRFHEPVRTEGAGEPLQIRYSESSPVGPVGTFAVEGDRVSFAFDPDFALGYCYSVSVTEATNLVGVAEGDRALFPRRRTVCAPSVRIVPRPDAYVVGGRATTIELQRMAGVNWSATPAGTVSIDGATAAFEWATGSFVAPPFVEPAVATLALSGGLSVANTVSILALPADDDHDGDGLTNGDEHDAGSSPVLADTDGDGLDDGLERMHGTDPTRADSDGDGIDDLVELRAGSDPNDANDFDVSSLVVAITVESDMPSPIYLPPASVSVLSLTVMAEIELGDGMPNRLVEVTDERSGTTYASSDPTVIASSGNGSFDVLRTGASNLTVTNGAHAATLPFVVTGCGDGVLQGNEGCDDGNVLGGDGCDAFCRAEGLRIGGEANGVEEAVSLLLQVERAPTPEPDGGVVAADAGQGQGQGPGKPIGGGAFESLELESDGTFWFATDVLPGDSYTVTVSSPEGYRCTVENGSGVVGTENVTDIRVECVRGLSARLLRSGDDASCVVNVDGSVECWGLHAEDTSAPLRQVPEGSYVDVAIRTGTACGLRADGSVACWGIDAPLVAAVPTSERFVAVSMGDGVACGVTADRRVVCWGDESHPARVAGLRTNVVDAVAVGRAVCWIDDALALHCVGAGAPELFAPPTDYLPDATPVAIYGGWSDTACVVLSRGIDTEHRCWGPEPLGGAASTYARAGSAGHAHVCMLSPYDDEAICFGAGESRLQAGQGDEWAQHPPRSARVRQLASGRRHTCFETLRDTIECTDALPVPGTCGDEFVDLDEVCDDGNRTSGDGCAADCQSDETCGNG
ncbi:MAG: DUF4215 domain-containing protein, partial [Myxococcales bacterium]|nr:DUF4215 domain-containing protein [Myxococcales bacterium]